MPSENPPPYTSSSRVAPVPDSKHSYDAVESGAQNIYPSAHDYLPPLAEPAASSEQHAVASAPSIPSAPPVQQLQRQHYQQSAPVAFPQHVEQRVYYTRPGVPVQIQTGTGPMVVVAGESVNFNIYRDGWVSRDCRIMTADKKSMAYHIEYPYSFFGSWHVNMRRGGPQGPTVFLITKSAMGWDFTIQDPSNPANTTKLSRSGGVIGKRKHMFKGFDGKQYAWKGASLGGDLKLVSYPTKTVAAYYHRTKRSWSKEGRLEVFANAQHLLDLIVATGFAVEEWERQNR